MRDAKDWAKERGRADWETEAGAEAFIREIQEDSRCFATGGFSDPRPLDPSTVIIAHHYETAYPRELLAELSPSNRFIAAYDRRADGTAEPPVFGEGPNYENKLVCYVPKHVFESFREFSKRNGAVAQMAIARLHDITKAVVLYLDTPTHKQTSHDLMALWEMAQNIRKVYWPGEFLE